MADLNYGRDPFDIPEVSEKIARLQAEVEELKRVLRSIYNIRPHPCSDNNCQGCQWEMREVTKMVKDLHKRGLLEE